MRLQRSREWWMRKAELEGVCEVSAGPSHLRAPQRVARRWTIGEKFSLALFLAESAMALFVSYFSMNGAECAAVCVGVCALAWCYVDERRRAIEMWEMCQ